MIVLVWHWATADTRKGHACAVLRGVEMGLPLVVAGKGGKRKDKETASGRTRCIGKLYSRVPYPLNLVRAPSVCFLDPIKQAPKEAVIVSGPPPRGFLSCRS
jgi:hypothetical protein